MFGDGFFGSGFYGNGYFGPAAAEGGGGGPPVGTGRPGAWSTASGSGIGSVVMRGLTFLAFWPF